MKLEINKKQMLRLVDIVDATTLCDIFGKHEVNALLSEKHVNDENIVFNENKIYVLKTPQNQVFKLTKMTKNIIDSDITEFSFASLNDSKHFAYPVATVEKLFEWVKEETDGRELLEFDTFSEFLNWYVVNY